MLDTGNSNLSKIKSVFRFSPAHTGANPDTQRKLYQYHESEGKLWNRNGYLAAK
jgi:hypothetical protein